MFYCKGLISSLIGQRDQSRAQDFAKKNIFEDSSLFSMSRENFLLKNSFYD
jgi:hypothetical protein